MKINISILFRFFLVACFTVATISIDAQTTRKIDPARIKEVVYPPLTGREGKDLTLPTPPSEHPRLFMRKSDFPGIKQKANHPLLKDAWERINQNAKFVTEGKLRQDTIHNYNLQILNAIEARAFMFVYAGDIEKGNEAIDILFNVHNTLIVNHNKGDVCRDIGRVILATAIVYDWCYDLLSADEKKELIRIMESLAVDMEVKWPQLVQGSVTGHGVEAQLVRDILSFGIAVYDENPEIYRRAAGRIFAEIIPAQNYWYQSGYAHQGSAYGNSRFQWEVYGTLIFDRMGYPNVVSVQQGKIPYRWIYTRRPDGQLFRDGDDYIERSTFGTYWSFPDAAYVASYYKDPLLMGEALRQGSFGRTPLLDLLLIDPSVPADFNLTSLPLTKYFPYPFGGMTARTGWEAGSSSSTAVADMKIVERMFNNHQHLDAGSFQLYYKGPLAVETGVYEGVEGGYGSPHFQNYYQRTIAHNCMLVYNPNETFTWHGRTVSNDGGQRWPGGAAEPRNIDVVMSEDYKTGEISAYGFGPDPVKPEYSYLKGDISRAYTDKVKNHQRAFVFLNLENTQVPAALIVYDIIVASNKDFKKTWLIHCVQEPVFSGNVCTVVRNEKGYNGKLVNTVLLPQSQNIQWNKVGGPDNKYTVNGINYSNYLRPNNSNDDADWRIELSPKIPSETDLFLNVMQVTDADNSQLLQIEQIDYDHFTGLKIADRIVLFAKNGNPQSQPVNLRITVDGTSKVLITDLERGNWEIIGPKAPGIVKVDQNLIYFQAIAGNYVITKK